MYKYKGKVIRVIDGDTIEVIIDVGFKITTNQIVRLYGIDACEKNDKDKAKKERAKKAFFYVINTCLGKEVELTTYKSDSFGRYLADVMVGDMNLSYELLKCGLVDKYLR